MFTLLWVNESHLLIASLMPYSSPFTLILSSIAPQRVLRPTHSAQEGQALTIAVEYGITFWRATGEILKTLP